MINICNIERFATHDGEGIRTVVFLQGCPLRCPWCANPESQIIKPHFMYQEHACVHCHTCVQTCPKQAIHFQKDVLHYDSTNCDGCQICVTNCPQNAIQFCGQSTTISDIMNEVLKDKAYYQESNGGITISGGEAFVQFDGFMELLKRCKQEGLHVTVETCGQYELDKLKKAYPYIDTFYFDIKHLDAAIYDTIVQGDLHQVLNNIHYLISKDPDKIVIRVPIIPEFNFDEKTLHAIIDFANKSHVKEVHFLPYHTLGKGKYEKMRQAYTWSSTPIKEEELLPYQSYAQEKDVKLIIGG